MFYSDKDHTAASLFAPYSQKDSFEEQQGSYQVFGMPYNVMQHTETSVGGIGPLPWRGSGAKGIGLNDAAHQHRLEFLTGTDQTRPKKATVIQKHPTESNIRIPGDDGEQLRVLLDERAKLAVNQFDKAHMLPFVQEKDIGDRGTPFDGKPLRIKNYYTAPVGLRKGPELKELPINPVVRATAHPNPLFSTHSQMLSEHHLLRQDNIIHSERIPTATPIQDESMTPMMNQNFAAQPFAKRSLHEESKRATGAGAQYFLPQSNDGYRHQQSMSTGHISNENARFAGAAGANTVTPTQQIGVHQSSGIPFLRPTLKSMTEQTVVKPLTQPQAPFALSVPIVQQAHQISNLTSGVQKQLNTEKIYQQNPAGGQIPSIHQNQGSSSFWQNASLETSLKQLNETLVKDQHQITPNMVQDQNPAVFMQPSIASSPSFKQSLTELQYQAKMASPSAVVSNQSNPLATMSPMASLQPTQKQMLETTSYANANISVNDSLRNANSSIFASTSTLKPAFKQSIEQLRYQTTLPNPSAMVTNESNPASRPMNVDQSLSPTLKQLNTEQVRDVQPTTINAGAHNTTPLEDLYQKHKRALIPSKASTHMEHVKTTAITPNVNGGVGAADTWNADSIAAIGSSRTPLSASIVGSSQVQTGLQGPLHEQATKNYQLSDRAALKELLSQMRMPNVDRSKENTPRLTGTATRDPSKLPVQDKDIDLFSKQQNPRGYNYETSLGKPVTLSEDKQMMEQQIAQRTFDSNQYRLQQLSSNPFVLKTIA